MSEKTKEQNADPDYRGELSPFRTEVKRGSTSAGQNTFPINSYVWYPDGFEQYLNDDFYHITHDKITAEDDRGVFDGTSISDITKKGGISDVVNKSAKYAKNQFDGVIKSIGGLFSETVDTKTPKVDPFKAYLDSIPYIRIYEFQPNNTVSELGQKFKQSFDVFDKFFKADKSTKKAITSELFNQNTLSEIFNSATDNKFKGDSFNSTQTKVLDIPSYMYTNLIGGFYTAQYDFPFFQQNDYYHGMGSTGWESRSLKQRLLPGGLSGMLDKFSDVASSFDIASKPKWNMDGSGPASDEITFEFMLFNSTDVATIRNIKLIHSLIGGNMWIQHGLKQLAPSLYDIEVPSRYRYYFCKADIKIEYAGKQRVVHESVYNGLELSKEITDINLNKQAFKFIPDAYKVIITFQSMIPNNFNTYMNYISNDSNLVSVGTERESIGNKFSSALLNKADKTIDENTSGKESEVTENDNKPLG